MQDKHTAEIEEATDWVGFVEDNGVSLSLGTLLLIMTIVMFKSPLKKLVSNGVEYLSSRMKK